jgi:hypothetical protein
MSDFPETYTAIGCQGAMEMETYRTTTIWKLKLVDVK